MKINDVLTESLIGDLATKLTNLGQSSDDLAKQKQQRAIKQVADAGAVSWANKVNTITRAVGGTTANDITPEEYKNQLMGWIEQNMTQRSLDSLTADSKKRIDNMVNLITNNRNNPTRVKGYFEQLVTVAAAAQAERSAGGGQPAFRAPAGSTPGQSQKSSQELKKEVQTFFASGAFNRVNQNAVRGLFSTVDRINSTGNVIVDEFLKQMGIKVT